MSIYLLNLAVTTLLSIIKIVCLLVAIAYFTLAERKIMAAVQRRVGPNVVGPFGLLQPLADGLKLAGKELAIPAQASSRIFLTVAMTVLLFALSGWSVIPFGMFDHSEYLSTRAFVKILLLTDPLFDYMASPFDDASDRLYNNPEFMKMILDAYDWHRAVINGMYAEQHPEELE